MDEDTTEREYVVFCLDMFEYGKEGTFTQFLHEADYLLLSLAKHVQEGNITVAEALEAWEPYRNLYDPQEEKWSIEEDIRFLRERGNIDEAQELEQELEEGRYDFPDYDALSSLEVDPPVAYIFRDEATHVAKELGIPDVGYFEVIMTAGLFSVESTEALEELRKAMAGKYKIVVKKDLDELYPYPVPSPEEAKRFIERHREQ